METHMIGKRHQKAVKAKSIPEVAMQSLSLNRSEMAVSSWRNKYRNPPPPSDDFQFETCVVKKKILTSFGEECIFMDQIDEEIFNTPWTDEPLTSSSDGEIIESPPKKISKEKTHTPPLVNKDEILLSDDDVPSRHRKKEKKSRRSPKSSRRSNKYSDDSDEDAPRHRSSRVTKPIKREEPEEQKPIPGVISSFGEYICEICNIKLTSQVTMQTHMIGKRHQKAVKAKSIPEVAMQSLSLNQSE